MLRELILPDSAIRRVVVSRYLLILFMVFAVLAYSSKHGRAAQAKFSPDAWRRAADAKSPNWSRKALLTQFVEEYKLDGMDRTKVISLLGEPASASELDPRGRYQSRIDTYCLSAKDEESLRIDYDDKDQVKVKGYFVERRPCKNCYLFIGPTSAANKFLTLGVLNRSFLQKYTAEQIRQMKMKQVETILGKSDKSWIVESLAGGQMWVNFYYLWRLSADGYRVFIIDGQHVPRRNWKSGEDPGVGSYAIVSMGQHCWPSADEPPQNFTR